MRGRKEIEEEAQDERQSTKHLKAEVLGQNDANEASGMPNHVRGACMKKADRTSPADEKKCAMGQDVMITVKSHELHRWKKEAAWEAKKGTGETGPCDEVQESEIHRGWMQYRLQRELTCGSKEGAGQSGEIGLCDGEEIGLEEWRKQVRLHRMLTRGTSKGARHRARMDQVEKLEKSR